MPNNAPFRVLMVLDHPYPPDVRVENEARSLVKAGFEVTLLAVSQDDRPLEEAHEGTRIVRDRLPIRVRNFFRGFVSTVPFMDVYLARRIKQVYAHTPFDAIHAHDLYLVGGALRAGRQLDVPVVADLHENWVEALKHYAWSTRFPGRIVVSVPRWERTERRWIQAADHLVVVIEEASERYEKMGVPPEKLTVVPNTVQLDAFENYPLDTDLIARMRSPCTIVYTGGIDAHRGLETVVQAMPHILTSQPEARLVVVGDGRTKDEVEERAQALGLAAHVRFEGWQPQSRLKSYIAAADVCLVPHLKTVHTDATIPHKLFHYMLMEKPVVVTDCRPLERIVRNEEVGLIYPSGDARALAEAVLALAADPEGGSAMGRRGREAVLTRYNWDATAAGLVKLYQRLADKRKGREFT